jgi:hypothetical protein
MSIMVLIFFLPYRIYFVFDGSLRKICPSDVHQPQIQFVKILRYLVNIWLHLIIF